MPTGDKEGTIRKLIIDILFRKWWSSALLRPNEYGVTKICILDVQSVRLMALVKDLLQRVLYGYTTSGDTSLARETNAYVTSKQYSSLSVTCIGQR